ncbi:MAG: PHD/YefM family antitoxin component YafN of YafNO toxin-antitoxin module [Phycisphaerales bacterium]|jgi:PHD/YefM family antitoxin component YafN of YafNO toxin-antitoxin module
MRLHPDFRSSYGSEDDVVALLGERTFKELNTVYLALREPPMKKCMALSDKRTKIEEHAKRSAEFVLLLAGLEKKAKKVGNNDKKDVLVEVKKDAAAVTVTKEAFESLKTEVEKTVSLKKKLEDKKLDQAKFKAYSTQLGRYESKLKEVKSMFKTCKVLHDNIKVKCEGFEKESEFKKIIKKLDTDYKMMDGVLTDYTKGVTKAAAAAKKAGAALKKK